MNFSQWLIRESSISELLKSTVDTYPGTTKRQYATDTIKITKLTWTPFFGLKTLFIKGLAQNEGREYGPIILFKDVVYGEGVPVIDNTGVEFKMKPVDMDKDDVLLRCQCGDFFWRWNYADSRPPKSLYGTKRKKYESLGLRPLVNPTNSPGMCKHLIKMIKVLKEAKLVY